ncbi:MAG: helix-turn-helix domain-containing protein [Defluviitaleaceae bacterium]|nr:helix-turn-helix domain-containing protein [Defluviitaleaceae bacterium]
MFADFPDVLTIADMKNALGVSNKMAYVLINSGKVKHFRMGKLIKIPKQFLIDYINEECYNVTATGKLPCQERSEML